MKLQLNSTSRRLKLCLLVLCFLTFVPAQAQRKSPPKASRKAVSNVRFASGQSAQIPFKFDGNIIYLEVRVNKSEPLKFIFDTGAGITVISARRAASMKLKTRDKVDASGVGGSVKGALSRGVSLEFAGVEVSNQLVAILPFDGLPCEVQDVDGIIGYDFIKEFVVEIDYAAQTLSLYDPKSYQDNGHGEVVPLMIERTPFVRAQVKVKGRAPVEGKFEIDTGSDSTLSINSPFIKKHKLLEAVPQASKNSGRGLGGESESFDVRLESLQLGSFVIKNPIVAFSQDTEGALASAENDGPLGNEILQRFKVTLDYSRQRMMLEPQASLSAPFEEDMSGISLRAEGAGCKILRVDNIDQNSPASEAGLRADDVLKAIDGKPADSYTSTQIEKLFKQEGVEHMLEVERGTEQLRFRIKLRRLI